MIIYTVAEAADKLKLSQRTIYEMLRDGRISAKKVGGSWRITHRELRRLTNDK